MRGVQKLFVILLTTLVYCEVGIVAAAKTDPIKYVKVKSDSGHNYNLKLEKPADPLLHPSVKVISASVNEETGHLSFDQWEPTTGEIRDAENVHIDRNNLASVRFTHSKGEESIVGVVNGMKIEELNGQANVYKAQQRNRSDYIDIGRKLTPPKERKSGPSDAVIELLVVCDKEFGDIFSHDRKAILDYLTVYFWDVNLRFETLMLNKITVRITGVVVIESLNAQPFIENARASDGRADLGRIMNFFDSWVYEQMSSLPKFDVATVMTSTNLEWGGGLAKLGSACWVNDYYRANGATTTFFDGGDWGSVTTAAHEIAHVLGAPHDDDTPDVCPATGFIMNSGADEPLWYFSTCTDRYIDEFVRSNQGSCLRRIDEVESLPIPSDFSGASAPSMDEQCRRSLRNPTAFVNQATSDDCTRLTCWVPNPDNSAVHWIWYLPLVLDNTPCREIIGGRCFRGRCHKQGVLFKNVGSGLCMTSFETAWYNGPITMQECPTSFGGTPLDRFAMTNEKIGTTLETPLSRFDNTSWFNNTGNKCIFTRTTGMEPLWTEECDSQDPMQGWDFISLENGEFMLSHRVTGKCAMQAEEYVFSIPNCDRNDSNFRWTTDYTLIYFPGFSYNPDV
ncbi:unnamed protein product [Orchesella dallaii]|uniref:Peptidase M12B domain-containing protein n=1 Tax=Orchesella dallaii TaxID=48710 RepID=A0ABP1QZ26_9HEXA